ncbi:hypothetical protein [Eubacterium sp.]|uniref:hypothetical protein n=1 Tax=Eubacterium sp. TaxID=142586 RepID=UPI0025EBD883|nr:hypothetical protein [Eubacterium sp.]MCR5630260.1 hypothetical protein [Eubacterium sp.]
MLISNNIFYPGKVNYNTFSIDFNKPFAAQEDELNEDLVQVEYNDNYILDIGWYPEGDINGRIIIQLIHNSEWDNPLVHEKCLDKESLFKSINNIMAIIESITETGGNCHQE